jgi:lysozyme family protein
MDYSNTFEKCIEVLLKLEGGYSDRPSDKGGPTNYGLSQKSYPDINMKTLTRDRAIEIYYGDYWIPMNLSVINDDELVLRLFCMGVNAGIRTTIKILQKLIGVVADGFIGSETARAIREFNGNIVDEFIKRQKKFYVALVQKDESQRPNLLGWLNRIEWTKF